MRVNLVGGVQESSHELSIFQFDKLMVALHRIFRAHDAANEAARLFELIIVWHKQHALFPAHQFCAHGERRPVRVVVSSLIEKSNSVIRVV